MNEAINENGSTGLLTQTGLSLKSQSRLVFRLKNLIHLERGDFLADLLDYIDEEEVMKELR